MATSLEAQHDLTVDSDGDTKGQHNVINSYNLVNVVHNGLRYGRKQGCHPCESGRAEYAKSI